MSAVSGRGSLEAVGEFGLIRRLQRQWPTSSSRVLRGIGEDAAVVTPAPGRRLLISADTFVEGVHFDRALHTPRDVGFRVGAANLSDIAAMGGRPLYLLVSMALPAGLQARHVRAIFRGMRDACGVHKVALIGGDTVSSPRSIVLTLTILGDAAPRRALTRRGARAGDRLYVTGTLGDARAGLRILRARARRRASRLSGAEHFVTQRHLRPTPRLGIARLLASRRLAHAAIDLSDGLSGDVGHLCDHSHVGVEIWANALPLSPQLRAVARAGRLDPVECAVIGGEDYELLFVASAGHHDHVLGLSGRTGVPIAWIGEITPTHRGRRLILPHGRARALVPQSYRHFAPRRGSRPPMPAW